MKTHIFRIYGRVQGVGFRYYTLKKANLLNIKGYVKNMADGSVFVLAQGEEENIEIFKKYLKRGPELSRVTSLEEEIVDFKSYSDFKIEI